MEAPFPFLLASLVPADAGDMLKRVASEMRCASVELDHWLINKREAQRSFDMVASRQEAGPFPLGTKLGLQEMAGHPRRERHCGHGVVRPTDEPRAAPLQEGESYQQTQQLALAERVTRYGASNVQVGCSLRSELNWKWVEGRGERGNHGSLVPSQLLWCLALPG